MTLDEGKALLSGNHISFELCEYQNEAAYWRHAMMFPYTKNAKPCKVIAMIVRSENGKKDIELQFNEVDDAFLFVELRFGDYCFEMFDYNEEMLADELIRSISEIKQGNLTVIVLNDLKKRRWIGDACYDLCDEDDTLGKPGFQKAMQRIKGPKGLIEKLLNAKIQYEFYDWNMYQCIVK